MLKKIKFQILIIGLVLLTGCAAIKTQLNTMELMKNYTFNASAEKIFEKVKQYYMNNNLTLTVPVKNMGITPWRQAYRSQGMISGYEKKRYRITVSPAGKNKSVIRVTEETVPVEVSSAVLSNSLRNEVVTKSTIRYIPSEFYLLQFIDPAAAKRMEAKAAKM